jgi:IS30 family transposase
MLKGKKFTQLREEERIKIEVLLNQGLSLARIARTLSRPVSTISREVKRNGPQVYRASRASYFTGLRHRQKRKHMVFDEDMKVFIKDHLIQKRLSPELIAVLGKRLRGDFICTEWIYRWIWAMKFSMATGDKKYQKLYQFLRHAHRRRKRGRKRNMRGNIIGRKWIEHRPEIVNKRSRQGDWEADIVLGKDRKPGLLVVLDRRSRKTWLRKLKVKDAAVVIKKLAGICQKAGKVRTITFDNDQSFAEHYRLNQIGIDTFFTHPYSSQEKGSVENRIGIVRMFFDKKTDFTRVTSAQVKSVENKINNRPLRMFNYKSPNEIHIS